MLKGDKFYITLQKISLMYLKEWVQRAMASRNASQILQPHVNKMY